MASYGPARLDGWLQAGLVSVKIRSIIWNKKLFRNCIWRLLRTRTEQVWLIKVRKQIQSGLSNKQRNKFTWTFHNHSLYISETGLTRIWLLKSEEKCYLQLQIFFVWRPRRGQPYKVIYRGVMATKPLKSFLYKKSPICISMLML